MSLRKVAIVTGSSSGNGRAIARRLARDGFAVVCSDIQRDALAQGYEADADVPTDEAIRREGGTALYAAADVSSLEQLGQVLHIAAEQFGRLDVMVNNAGIAAAEASIVEETEEAFDKTIAVNLKGVWIGSKLAVTQFLKQEVVGGVRGTIINIASVGGMIGRAGEPAYCASKGGALNLTRQVAVEFASERIRAVAVCPGFVATAMVRELLEDPAESALVQAESVWPEIGTAEDVADSVSFLASDQARFINGSAFVVDGGLTAR